MKNIILLLFLLVLSIGYSQKFAIVENKGENSKYFDYNDPNSLVSILKNNSRSIPSKVLSNGYSGVYDDELLNKFGISKDSMMTFNLSSKLKVYNNCYEDTMIFQKTSQTFEVFFDSLSKIGCYEEINYYSRDKLKNAYNSTPENGIIRIRTPYYFDTKNIHSFLIEKTEKSSWVHFIKKYRQQNMICLSLTFEQVSDMGCLVNWYKMKSNEKVDFLKQSKEYLLDTITLWQFDEWKLGLNDYFNNYSNFDSVFSFPASSCDINIDSEGNSVELINSINPSFIEDISSKKKRELTQVRCTQSFGKYYCIYRSESGDTMCIYKTNQSFEVYIDSLMKDSDNHELKLLDIIELKKCWDNTSIGNALQKDRESIELWVEPKKPEVLIAYVYNVSNKENPITILQANICEASENNQLLNVMQISDLNQNSSFHFDFKTNEMLPTDQSYLKPNGNFKYKKSTYNNIKSKLKLINDKSKF